MTWLGHNKENPTIAIIGMGYVGLPLALQFSRTCRVLGIDFDAYKLDCLRSGSSYIKHISGTDVREAVNQCRLVPMADMSAVSTADAIIICVPTPLTKQREPDLSCIKQVGENISGHLRKGQLVVLESTTYPFTTSGVLRPILECTCPLKAGVDFHLAFSPEREDPGNKKYKTADIPKVVGGLTPQCGEAATELYSKYAGLTVVPVLNTETAEAVKLMENIFRCVNIAMVNELKIIFDKMGINIWDVIEAAKTKPFGYMPFYPGPGLGGHCIPIDPFYLTWKAREFGVTTRFIELAGEINTEMPSRVVLKTMEALSSQHKPMSRSLILILGVAYKKDVDDMRESPAFSIWKLLHDRDALVSYYDPHIPHLPTCLHEYPRIGGFHSIECLTPEILKTFDAVVVVTDHTSVDYGMIAKNAKLIVDTRNVFKNNTTGTLVRA